MLGFESTIAQGISRRITREAEWDMADGQPSSREVAVPTMDVPTRDVNTCCKPWSCVRKRGRSSMCILHVLCIETSSQGLHLLGGRSIYISCNGLIVQMISFVHRRYSRCHVARFNFDAR